MEGRNTNHLAIQLLVAVYLQLCKKRHPNTEYEYTSRTNFCRELIKQFADDQKGKDKPQYLSKEQIKLTAKGKTSAQEVLERTISKLSSKPDVEHSFCKINNPWTKKLLAFCGCQNFNGLTEFLKDVKIETRNKIIENLGLLAVENG